MAAHESCAMRAARTLAVGLVAVLVASATAPPASGFSLKIHDEILEQALGDGNTMSEEALKWVKGSFLLGLGNAGSDRDQLSPERHFDGARSAADICELWRRKLNTALDLAVTLSAPEGAEKRQLKDRKKALEAYGEATHAIADFYSHTNWIELHGQAFKANPLAIPPAPLLSQKCDPASFPRDLQSGYFNLGSGLDGCPSGGPPQGYQYCHSQLAKDHPDKDHGRVIIADSTARCAVLTVSGSDGSACTYHRVARWLSTKATRSAWRALHDRILAKYTTDETIDPECLFMKLAWGGERSCHRLWRVEGQITTHQEYLGAGARHLLDLTLTTVQIKMKTDSVEYPGPQVAAVYAPVSGPGRVAGTLCGRLIMPGKPGIDRRECHPFKFSNRLSPVEARLRVSPGADPIELNWHQQFPGKKTICAVVVRLDHTTGTTQAFPNCAGTTIGPPYTLIALRFSGQFKVLIDSP